MSMNPDGTFACDRCGADVDNGGIQAAVVVSDLDPEARGMIRNLHFCRDRVEGEDESREEIRGCEHKVLTPSNLANYTAVREAARG